LRAQGRPGDALAEHRRARTLATDVGDRYEEARAAAGCGAALYALNHPDLARAAGADALRICTDLRLPEADELRSRLTLVESTADRRWPG
jgi:hypothetical protein